jgi:hypothetical protein
VQETQEHLGDTSQQNQLTAGPAEAPGPIWERRWSRYKKGSGGASAQSVYGREPRQPRSHGGWGRTATAAWPAKEADGNALVPDSPASPVPVWAGQRDSSLQEWEWRVSEESCFLEVMSENMEHEKL